MRRGTGVAHDDARPAVDQRHRARVEPRGDRSRDVALGLVGDGRVAEAL
jgi:hypothetical protein